MLYQVAMVQEPSSKEKEETGALEKLILEPTWVIAANEQSAAVLASRKAGPDVVINEQTKILVRPFC